ncbi:hypothetical protein SORBI_3003G154450 [Sorghum bicolor]|uniref:DUF4283 domain-containing protein n=1 Tax=Sorghum bicolor TaxID=4558 RepID=A0A1W0VXG5_SORBI|nr:hypothetical protein SORBI_3003G154450 [Sorghum bicolor]
MFRDMYKDLPEAQTTHTQSVGLVTVLEGMATVEKLNEDLRMVVDDKWNYQVKQLFTNEYMVIFPDISTLATFSRIGYLELPIHQLKVKISISKQDPKATSLLQTCWVKIHNVPTIAREVAAIKGLASLVGQPLVVDELSLIRDEPVRVKINCREPAAIRCVIEIFFNKEGREIKFVAEGFEDKQLIYKGNSSGPGKYDDKRNKRDPGDKEDPKTKRRSDKFERIGKIDKEKDHCHGDSQEDLEEGKKADSGQVIISDVQPIASFHPVFGFQELLVHTGMETGMFDKGVTKEKENQAGTETQEVPEADMEVSLNGNDGDTSQ